MNDRKTIKALIVDDEKIIRDFLTRFLSSKGMETKAVDDEFKAIEAAKKEKFDIVFLELKTPKMSSSYLVRELKKINPQSKYVITTACLEDDLWEEAKKEGVTACLKKPFEIDEIMSEIDEIRRLRKGL